ncbi:hypothetical protein LTR97_008671 [Elasticomyces elasticus]|uniref:Uncharacterized protein n=1 Tax=Elasticomyces elasticus TaxID=574655 RepID=A0AAN7W3T2_9PEZI|nr:hypothetical protein LTR97_008671 [Elasticomyces elasticus]
MYMNARYSPSDRRTNVQINCIDSVDDIDAGLRAKIADSDTVTHVFFTAYIQDKDTFKDILSRMEIFAAINHDKCGNGGVFNVADGQVVTWAEVWPRLYLHFELVGGGPRPGSTSIHDFVEEHWPAWEELTAEHGIKASLIDEQGWGVIWSS